MHNKPLIGPFMGLTPSYRSTRFQHKTTCETLARLVEASLDPMELEAKASPSTKFVIGNGRVQPTSPDEIVKARCVDGSAFPEGLATNCRGLDYLSFAPNTFFEEEEAIIHFLVHATKAHATHLLAALPDHRG